MGRLVDADKYMNRLQTEIKLELLRIVVESVDYKEYSGVKTYLN